MEFLSSKFLSSAHSKFSGRYFSVRALHSRAKRVGLRKFLVMIKCKKSSYQDFQGYAKPSRLLPSTEVKVSTDVPVEKQLDCIPYGDVESTYKVRLRTSNIYGSGLTDLNSGILLCLIDENGSSILQRLPATLTGDDGLHFQRGSSDEFTFKGPKLRRVIAVWIGLESGQWRMGDISLTVLSHPLQNPSSAESLHYNFVTDDIFLGDKSDSMVELRPHSVTSYTEDISPLLVEKSLNTSNEESMREYTNLKLSLLLYDAMLVLGGSVGVASLSTEGSAFLAGGLTGFIYLLLLQRSVDGLPTPEIVPTENKGYLTEILDRLKGPVFGLMSASAFAMLAVKYVSTDGGFKLTPEDVVFGMMGFLMCKVAVVLAAVRPISLSFKEHERNS